MFLSHKIGVLAHAVEHGLLVGQQVLGWVELDHLSLRQDEDLVVVHDGVEPVSDRDDGAIGKLVLDGVLQQKDWTF